MSLLDKKGEESRKVLCYDKIYIYRILVEKSKMKKIKTGKVMTLNEKVIHILKGLSQAYPQAHTALHYQNPLEILIATILSAQCTDKRVNEVTKTLFKKYKTPQDYAQAPLAELEEDIRSTGFFHNKAKNIQGCCRELIKRHHREGPADHGRTGGPAGDRP